LKFNFYYALDEEKKSHATGEVKILTQSKLSGQQKVQKSNLNLTKQKNELVQLGNYLLVAFDVVFWKDDVEGAYLPCHVGCSVSKPFEKTIVQWLAQENSEKNKVVYNRNLSGTFFTGNIGRTKGKTFFVTRLGYMKHAVQKITDEVEQLLGKIRPCYDGAIILVQNDHILKFILKGLRKDQNIKNKFLKVFKGYTSMENYVRATGHTKFCTSNYSIFKEFTLSLDQTARILLGDDLQGLADQSSTWLLKILSELSKTEVNYANFYSKYSWSTQSGSFQDLLSQTVTTTYSARLKAYLPLEQYLSENLANHEESIFVLGLEEAVANLKSKAEWLSRATIKVLLSSSVEFEALCSTCREDGMDELEKLIDQNYLQKCVALQTPNIVGQTTHTAKLIMRFFKEGAHMVHDISDGISTTHKPCFCPDQAWTSFKPLITHLERSLPDQMANNEISPRIRSLICLLVSIGIDYDRLFVLWKISGNFMPNLSEKLKKAGEEMKIKLDTLFFKHDWALEIHIYFDNHQENLPKELERLIEEEKLNNSEENLFSSRGNVSLWSIEQIDQLSFVERKLQEMLPPEGTPAFNVFEGSYHSLTSIRSSIGKSLQKMIFPLNGDESHVERILDYIQKLLALSNLSFTTLMSLRKTNNLEKEVGKMLRKHQRLAITLLDSENLSKIISSHFNMYSINAEQS